MGGARDAYYANYAVTVPKGTTIANPQKTTLQLADAWVYSVSYYVPPGPSGVVGFYFATFGNQVIPFTGNTPWFVVDTDKDTFQVGYEVNGGLQFIAYNTGLQPHTVQIRIKYQYVAVYFAELDLGSVPIDAAAVGGSPGAVLPSSPAPVVPPPQPPPVPPTEDDDVSTFIVTQEGTKDVYLVTTEPRTRSKVASAADESAYLAAGVKRLTLSTPELETYTLVK